MSEIISFVNIYDGNIPTIFNLTDFKTHQDIENSTIQYVDTGVSTLIAGAPIVLDTIQEIANALNNDGNLYNTLNNKINLKADSSSITTINNQISSLQNTKNYSGNMELFSSASVNFYIDYHAKKSNSDYDLRMQIDDAGVPNTTGSSNLRITGAGLIIQGNLSVTGSIAGPTTTNIYNRLSILKAPLCAGYLLSLGSSSSRRVSSPITTTSAFYGPLVVSNLLTINPGFRLLIYTLDSFAGTATTIDNTTGTLILSLSLSAITVKSIQVFYKNVAVQFPNI
jgi:hypothetical protein